MADEIPFFLQHHLARSSLADLIEHQLHWALFTSFGPFTWSGTLPQP
jgi:hypothetical protein